MCSPLLERDNEHPAACARGYGDWLSPDATDPGMTAGLDALQGFVVVNVLGIFRQIDDNFSIAIWQEPVEVVEWRKPIKINQVLNEMIEWKNWMVGLKYHLTRC